MRIWLISPHDAVPGDSWGQRHAIDLSKTLAARGHDVTYWAASYSHAMKRQRGRGWQQIQIEPRFHVILVPAISYSRNVGLARVWFYRGYASRLWQRCRYESRPDVIITSVGTPFVDSIVVRLACLHRAALITEFRDLWPDLFPLAFPKPVRGVINSLLLPLYKQRNLAFEKSSALSAVCKSYLRYAQKASLNIRRIPTRVIYHSGISMAEFQEKMRSSDFDAEMPAKPQGEVWAIYAGTLGYNYDIRALLEAARVLSKKKEAHNIKFIIAGDGPMRSLITQYMEDRSLGNLKYVGVLDLARLCRYYAKADLGLSTYARGSTVVIPAKAYDYYAAELPIINSLKGEFADFLCTNNIGTQYEAGDPLSLATAVLDLANDKPRRDSMRLRLRKIAPEFDLDKQYGQFYELLPTTLL